MNPRFEIRNCDEHAWSCDEIGEIRCERCYALESIIHELDDHETRHDGSEQTCKICGTPEPCEPEKPKKASKLPVARINVSPERRTLARIYNPIRKARDKLNESSFGQWMWNKPLGVMFLMLLNLAGCVWVHPLGSLWSVICGICFLGAGVRMRQVLKPKPKQLEDGTERWIEEGGEPPPHIAERIVKTLAESREREDWKGSATTPEWVEKWIDELLNDNKKDPTVDNDDRASGAG